jgi:hypothetical protein
MLEIGKTLTPCVRVLGIIHAKDVHDHLIYDLGLAIYLGVEGCVRKPGLQSNKIKQM